MDNSRVTSWWLLIVQKRYVCKYCHTHILPFGFKGVWVKWCGSDCLETWLSLGWSQTSDDPVSYLPEYCDDRSLSRCPGYHILYFYDSYLVRIFHSYLSLVILKSLIIKNAYFHLCFSTLAVTEARLKTMLFFTQCLSIFDLSVLIRELLRMKESDRSHSGIEHRIISTIRFPWSSKAPLMCLLFAVPMILTDNFWKMAGIMQYDLDIEILNNIGAKTTSH